MQHTYIIREINSLVVDIDRAEIRLAELREKLPPYEWMLQIAEKHKLDTTHIKQMMIEREEDIKKEQEILDEIKILKIEIKLSWKRVRNTSSQR